jgi:short-subunit dehydrogenase
MMTGFQARARLPGDVAMLRTPMVMAAARVAKIAYRDMTAGKTVSVPGTMNAMGAFASVHAPHAISARVVRGMHESRQKTDFPAP